MSVTCSETLAERRKEEGGGEG